MIKHSHLDLIEHQELKKAINAWENLSNRDKAHWDAKEARAAILDSAFPTLAEKGVVRIRLLDEPNRFDEATLSRLLVSVAQQFGFLMPQTYANNLTAFIQDTGNDYSSHKTRGHQTNAELAFHSDRCDLNVMLYVRGALEGGNLSVVPYETAAQNLEMKNAESLAILFEDFPFDLRNERIFPCPEWYIRPILWKSSTNNFRGHYIRRFINDSQRHADCPRLTQRQILALDEFDACLGDIRSEHSFLPVPGELVIFDNFKVMHARDSFKDIPDKTKGRLVIRTWVAPFYSETLPGFLLPMMGAINAGSFRGGIGNDQGFLESLGKISN